MSVLLAGGADPNIRNIVDATPIFEAIDEDNLEIVMALVEAGAGVKTKNTKAVPRRIAKQEPSEENR